MYKKTITYPNFDGVEITEDFYFHVTQAELVELEVSEKDGFTENLQKIIASNDGKVIIETFKKIILMSVGQRSANGRGFDKDPEFVKEFAGTEAYSQLFVELATNAGSAAEFVNNVIPKKLAEAVEAQQAEQAGPPAEVEIPAVPVSEENLENVESAARPLAADFAAMSQEEFEAWKANQG